MHAVDAGEREATHRVVLEASDGRVLGATNAGTDLRTAGIDAAAADPATRWVVNTTDGRGYSLVNEKLAVALDVNGQSTANGATVGVYGSNGGANQTWDPRDLAPLDGQTVAARTAVGTPPVLPETVVPRYAWGAGVPVPVIWRQPDERAWAEPGRVEVPGTATDVFGGQVAVTALVDVGGLTATDPVSMTVAVGAAPNGVESAAPTTVPARIGASENTFDVPVTWDWSSLPDGAFDEVGVVRVPGEASADGTTLAATLSVIVTEGSLRNVNPDPGTTASASSTESGYPVDRTRNGVEGDKGWSNWVSSNKPAQSTLTYAYAAAHQVEQVSVQFYRDGTTSWAQTMQVLLRAADGTWLPAPGWESFQPVASPADGSAPTVVASFDPVTATGVRVVMNAYPNTHLIVSEVKVFESVPSPAAIADLAALRIDGVTIDGFDPETHDYAVDVAGGRLPVVDAIALDRDATVRVSQPAAAKGWVGTVGVTSADGSVNAVYTVTIRRHATIDELTLADRPRVGTPVASVGVLDPVDGEIAYRWLSNGEPIDGATEATYTPVTRDAGKLLSVEVTVSADGVAAATAETPAQRVLAANARKPE
ncbi:RICIN domain-containing protein [Agromyces endophyticus]|uniref:RICIN domain-containing protein n=1 Tax=Agromyces sp. H17E-10 TaxID=2932244 RepID=UPI001FD54418|nr:RICIN domain-containing protein [Agromyces sp. H17E-10]UOQ90111.1 RICIN domain-containing protein [Agromyces sp. H17E-10]